MKDNLPGVPASPQTGVCLPRPSCPSLWDPTGFRSPGGLQAGERPSGLRCPFPPRRLWTHVTRHLVGEPLRTPDELALRGGTAFGRGSRVMSEFSRLRTASARGAAGGARAAGGSVPRARAEGRGASPNLQPRRPQHTGHQGPVPRRPPKVKAGKDPAPLGLPRAVVGCSGRRGGRVAPHHGNIFRGSLQDLRPRLCLHRRKLRVLLRGT
jgi:hypothetical protein